jgi:hypothetical protein
MVTANSWPFASFRQPIAHDAALIEAGDDLQLTAQAKVGISYAGQLAHSAHDHSVKGPADSTYWPAARACKILHPPQPYDGGKHQEDDKKKCNPLQFCCPLGSRCRDSSPPKLLFRASVTWLTHPLPVPP